MKPEEIARIERMCRAIEGESVNIEVAAKCFYEHGERHRPQLDNVLYSIAQIESFLRVVKRVVDSQ